ncbi:hypothetical protein [Actinomadura napierensis]|uniref:Uncharacterized protein n=1 Tax=Actinomadura napierensis TaxID=267854 RepID=A0ABN3AJ48_9ACTN
MNDEDARCPLRTFDPVQRTPFPGAGAGRPIAMEHKENSMVQLLQGRPHMLDQTNRAVRKHISDRCVDLDFADLWNTGNRIALSSGRNPVSIHNQGVGFDVVDNTGHAYGRGQQIAAKGGNATYAVVRLADSLKENGQDPHHAAAVMAAVRNALQLSAGSDPGHVYLVVP